LNINQRTDPGLQTESSDRALVPVEENKGSRITLEAEAKVTGFRKLVVHQRENLRYSGLGEGSRLQKSYV
jgi:hypothetical protein